MFAWLPHVSSGPYDDITMIQPPVDATEGVAKSVICSVTYKCKKNTPNITWNFEDMQSSLSTKQVDIEDFKTVSNLTFIGSLEDIDKSLICTAHFNNGKTSASHTLQIKSKLLFVITSGDLNTVQY